MSKLYAAVGGSLGGMQILQWALDHPDEIERAVLVCATARLTAQNIAFSKVARHAILTHDAMDVARMMAHITYVSDESLRRKFDRARRAPDAGMTLRSDFEVEFYLDHQSEIFLKRFDPHTYLYLSRVMDYFDPFAEAYERTPSTRFLLVSFDTDWRFGTEHSVFIEEQLRAREAAVARHEVASPWGHDSFLMDVPEYHELVRRFLVYQEVAGAPLSRVMPVTEVCVIHPGALSASSWARLASHLPAGTPVKVLELETINRYWAADPELTVEALADRLRPRLADPARPRARGLGRRRRRRRRARRPRRGGSSCSTASPRRDAAEPREAELLRSFAMYAGARRGRALEVDPARLRAGLEPALAHILDVASAAGALREDTTLATVRRCYEQHAARVLRDHRLVAGYEPSGAPLTVVKAADSIAPDSPALGWDRFAPVELLASGGDHYSMLTDPASAAHLAMLLRRWLDAAHRRRLEGELPDELVELGREPRELLARARDLLRRGARLLRRGRDLLRGRARVAGHRRDLLRRARDALDAAADVVDARGQAVERGARLDDGLGRVLGQLADLVGDDREAAAVLAGARGLDRGVEREQVRLLGDVGDLARQADAVARPPRAPSRPSRRPPRRRRGWS